MNRARNKATSSPAVVPGAVREARATRSGRSTAEPGAARAARRTPVRTDDIRLLCVDDHAVLVEGLKAQFAVDGGIQVVGWLGTAERLLEETARLRADAVLLDIEMPGPDAFELADRLRREQPAVRVIVLSAHVRDAFISASFRAGICAYFSKSDELSDIVAGIRKAVRDRESAFFLGPKVAERCRPIHARVASRGTARTQGTGSGDETGAPTTGMDTLTDREAEILRFIGKGLSRTQIAAQLCRSAKTVDGHQDRMMKKLGITSRADLMRYAIREGVAQA